MYVLKKNPEKSGKWAEIRDFPFLPLDVASIPLDLVSALEKVA